jgi:hypothetical protein
LLIAVLFWSPLAKGQTDTGSLTIRTTDIDGVGIAGATVTLTDKVRGQSWVKTTTAGGEAFFGSLEPGSYRVAVRHPDFSGEQTQDPVEVRVGVILTLTFTYKFKLHGPFKITSLPEVQIEWSNVGMPHNVTSASRTELLELPNLDNDLTPLLQVVPGAIAAGPASLGRVIIDGKGKDQQISRLDGLDASPLVDLPTGDPTLGVLDSFQKQSVTAQGQTSAVSGAFIPLFGPSTGAVTDTATLGGGISFKFQLYEVFRNDALDARNFFDSDNKSGLRRSQFGGKLAGPIPLNKKLFFFLGYEGIRGRTERNMFEAVPSDAACRCGSGPLVPFLGGYLPPGTTVVPGSSSNPDFLVASRPGRTTSASNAWDARIDFLPFNDAKDAAGDPVPKAKDALIFRFTRQAGEAALPDGVTGRLQRQRVLFVNTLVKVSLVTTNSVHEFKFGLNETRGHADTEIPSSTSPALSSSLIALGGTVNAAGLPGGSQSVPVATLGGLVKGVGRGFDLTPYSLTAAYDMTHSFTFKGGLHVLQAGVEARSIRFSFDRLGGLTYSFQNAAAMRAGTPGTVTFLSDLSGPAPFDGGTGPRHARQQYYMGYVQVMSKLNTPGAAGTPGYNLTLTYGFRYDFFGTARERDDRAVVVDPLTGQFLAPGTPFYRARKNNFEPRFGVTYQLPFKTGLFANTLLQAGVGVYLGAPRIGDLVIPIESDRFSTGSSGGTFPTNPGQMVQSFLSNPDTRQFQPLAFSRDFSTPERAYKWEASVTRMIGEVYDVKLAYSGNAGRNLPLAGIANQIVRVETNPDPTKPAIVIRQFDIISGDQVFKPFGEFFYRTSAGRSSFNAMTISLQKNDSKEIPKQKWLRFKGFKAQYTLSRNVGNASGTTASDPTNFGADYGYNAADARHSFSFSAIYPLAEALERKPSSLLWGWTVAPQVTARSGFPLIVRLDRPDVVYVDGSGNVFASPAAGRQAVINTPGGGATGGTRVPDLIAGVNPYLRNGLELLNPAAFAIPAPGRFGNLKRGQLRGPGTFQLDLALTRRIFDPEKTHKVTADFKIEVFNLLNHTNFNNPTASLPNVLGTDGANNQLQPGAPFTRAAAGAFGVFSAADPGRQIQFSLTFKFNEGP